MNKFIVLLRAVNVSGKNIIKMAELKKTLTEQGFKDVLTYIQSGNIILNSEWNKTTTKNKLKECISSAFGFDINLFVFTKSEIREAKLHNPFFDKEANRVFITFLEYQPESDLVEKLSSIVFTNEYFSIHKKVLYYYLPNGVAKAKMSNSFFENKLKVKATGRNINTIEKLIDLS